MNEEVRQELVDDVIIQKIYFFSRRFLQRQCTDTFKVNPKWGNNQKPSMYLGVLKKYAYPKVNEIKININEISIVF